MVESRNDGQGSLRALQCMTDNFVVPDPAVKVSFPLDNDEDNARIDQRDTLCCG